MATKVMLGKTLVELGVTSSFIPPYFCVKEVVMPFNRFNNVDPILGPEMKSTGEVMGIDTDLGAAFAKAQFGAGQDLPIEGTVFISVQDKDKEAVLPVVQQFYDLGFVIAATSGTAEFLRQYHIPATMIKKVSAGRPNVVDAVKNKEIQLIVNTSASTQTKEDGYAIRRAAVQYTIPYTTTVSGAKTICMAIATLKSRQLSVMSIQEYHAQI